jgi:hypothetical protein
MSEGEQFHSEREVYDLAIPTSDKKIKLILLKNPDSEELDSLILKAGGFSSENEALEYASKIKNSIYLSGLLLKKAFKIIELSVGEEGILRISGAGEYLLSDPIDRFISKFKEASEQSNKLTNKQSLALELFNMSYFEGSPRASFITLVTSVECFTKRYCRPPLFYILSNFIEDVEKMPTNNSDKESLKNGLIWLGFEGIARTCRKLVERVVNKDAANKFSDYYKIRSDLVHNGTTKDDIDIVAQVRELRGLVQKLLIKDIEKLA